MRVALLFAAFKCFNIYCSAMSRLFSQDVVFVFHESPAEMPIGYDYNSAPVWSPSFPAKTWVASLIDSSMAPLESACDNTVTFTATAAENDPDQTVSISYVPYIPFGATMASRFTMSPAGRTASASFSWRASCVDPVDVGSYIFCLRATDSNELGFGKRSSTLCIVIVINEADIYSIDEREVGKLLSAFDFHYHIDDVLPGIQSGKVVPL